MRHFAFFFCSYEVLEIQCILYTYSTSQYGLAIFQGLNSHTWLAVAIRATSSRTLVLPSSAKTP